MSTYYIPDSVLGAGVQLVWYTDKVHLYSVWSVCVRAGGYLS